MPSHQQSAGIGRSAALRRLVLVVAAILGLSTGLLGIQSAEAAPPAGKVKARTQRMVDATLKTTQVGWYNAGSRLTLVCYKRGQQVWGYYGGPNNLWYLTADGYYAADADMDTGTNNPVTGPCPATASIDTSRSYTITSRNSGKLIDIRGGVARNGTAVQQYVANNTKSQSFKFISTGGGFYRIVSELSGSQVWDVSGAKTSNRTKVQTWNWGGAGAANQQWMPVAVAGGYVTFKPRHAFSNMCLDLPYGSKNNGVQLELFTCNGGTNQQWKLTAKPVPGPSMASFVTKYNGAKGVTSVLPAYPYPGQCTSFVTRYLQEVLGITLTGWGNANTWAGSWGDSARLASKGLTWHGGATDFRNGDILVWDGNGTGHVGLWYNGQVFDQNDARNNRAYDSKTGTYAVGFASFWSNGYLGYWRRG